MDYITRDLMCTDIRQAALEFVARAVVAEDYHSAAYMLRWALESKYTTSKTWREDILPYLPQGTNER